MGHVIRMTMTGAAGLTFVFAVDAVNLFWIAQLGNPVLQAAIGYAFAIQFLAVSIGVGLMIATVAIVSRSIGAGDRALARRQGTAGLLMTMIGQTLTALGVVLFRHDLLALLGAEGEALRLGARYLAISMPSLFLMSVGLGSGAVLRAEGDGRRAMNITLLGGTVLMIVDPILIYVMGLGLDGAAIGIWLFRIAMALIGLHYTTRVYDLLARPTLAGLRETFPSYIRIALPSIATQLAAPFGNALLTGVVAQYGDQAVGAWAVINRLTVVAFGGLFSLSGAVGGILGQNFGGGRLDRVRQTYLDALVFCAVYTGIIWAVLLALTGVLAKGFGLDGESASMLRSFTSVGVGAFAFAGALFVANSAFNTLGRPLWASLLSWFKEAVLTLPVALWLGSFYAAHGAIYGQALVAVVTGIGGGLWGWWFVTRLRPALDATARAA